MLKKNAYESRQCYFVRFNNNMKKKNLIFMKLKNKLKHVVKYLLIL